MKLRCEREPVLEMLQIAASVAESKDTRSALNARPILSCVKIDACGDVAKFFATDLQVAVCCRPEGIEIVEPGMVAINAAKTLAIFRETPDEHITIEITESTALISSSDGEFNIPISDVEEFPDIPVFEEAQSFELPAAEFKDMVSLTSFSAAREATRYALNGVFLSIAKGKIDMVATDGLRLARYAKKESPLQDVEASAIIPTKAVDELFRSIGDEDDVIRIALWASHFMAQTKHVDLYSSVVDGNFPPYQNVIPKDCDKKFNVPSPVLMSAVRRVALLADEKSKVIRFLVKPNCIELNSVVPEAGEAHVTVPIDYDGEEVEMTFNAEFILDFLRVIDADTVRLALKNSRTAGVFKVGQNYTYVIMPVKVD